MDGVPVSTEIRTFLIKGLLTTPRRNVLEINAENPTDFQQF